VDDDLYAAPKLGRPRLIDQEPNPDTLLDDIEQFQMRGFLFVDDFEKLMKCVPDEILHNLAANLAKVIQRFERFTSYWQYNSQVALGVDHEYIKAPHSEAVSRGIREKQERLGRMAYDPRLRMSWPDILQYFDGNTRRFYDDTVEFGGEISGRHLVSVHGKYAMEALADMNRFLRALRRDITRRIE
jgi:hypothetical protein